MKRLFHLLAQSVAAQAANRIGEDLVGAVRVKALRFYVRGIGASRRLFLLALGVLGALALALAGFVLAHLGLFLLLPWEPAAKGWLAAGLGLFYLLIASLVLAGFCRQRAWLKAAGADRLLESVSSKAK